MKICTFLKIISRPIKGIESIEPNETRDSKTLSPKRLFKKKRKKHPAKAKYRAIDLTSKSNLVLVARLVDKTIKINPRENMWLKEPKIEKLTRVSKTKIL